MRHIAVVPIFAALTVACSSDPTGPGGGGGGATEWQTTLSVSSIIVAEMCDGFPVDIDGGEWTHQLTSRFLGGSTRIMGGTQNYPSASQHVNIGRGGSMQLDATARNQRHTGPAAEGDVITMTIRATEWDFDVFGNNPFPDSRMDNRAATATFTFEGGAWPQVPNGTLVLQNTSSCRVVVNYSFEAVAM